MQVYEVSGVGGGAEVRAGSEGGDNVRKCIHLRRRINGSDEDCAATSVRLVNDMETGKEGRRAGFAGMTGEIAPV